MTAFVVPAHIQARLTTLPIDQRPAGPDVEAWWANVWSERGLPDPVTVDIEVFRGLIGKQSRVVELSGEVIE